MNIEELIERDLIALVSSIIGGMVVLFSVSGGVKINYWILGPLFLVGFLGIEFVRFMIALTSKCFKS
ncbi:hypothetical protein KY347_00880 [Candidatus Woesearchaeota archaeon]|nr:hypothetical protein [Candidatus Woesearchaeota archaeon]